MENSTTTTLTPSSDSAPPPRSNHHYDQNPRIFELFLDPSLKYSSGLFKPGVDDLHGAQLAKMDWVAEQLHAGEGTRVLDVGCGWGSLTLHLARRFGCSVTGITPSPAQARFIEQRAREQGVADRVSIALGTFDTVSFGQERFDAISMLGSITHMEDKPGAVARARSLLRRDGWYYLSESAFRNAKVYDELDSGPGVDFIRHQIFGWGELIPFSSFVRYCEDAGLSLKGLTDLTEDYRKTIEFWRENATRNRDELDAIQPGKTDELLKFFDICNTGWGLTTKHYALVCQRRR